MQKQHPTAGDFIEISLKQLIAVRYAAMLRDKANWEIVEEAIDHWLRKQEPSAVGEPEFAGYQWKNLFLPHGTVLRTAYNGKNVHCHVENDRITYEGKAVSPSGFVSAVGGIRRNAWKSIWLLLPDAKHWQLADHMRVRRRRPPKARTRSYEAGSRTAPAGAPTPAIAAAAATMQRADPGQHGAPPPAQGIACSPAIMQQADSAPRAAPPPAQSIGASPTTKRQTDPAPSTAPPLPAATPCESAPSTVVPRAAPPAIAGWTRKPRPRPRPAGTANRLVALLRRCFQHDEGRRWPSDLAAV
ncbi:MAG TPA: hypothetical protein VFS95_04580 [Telluria sp.]|nr:hypothetical protein [Telluria sp.]